jgi:hypothetical protein
MCSATAVAKLAVIFWWLKKLSGGFIDALLMLLIS